MGVLDIPTAIAAVAEAVRSAASQPADAIRCLSALADFYPSVPPVTSPVGRLNAVTIIATAALCRQAALNSLALACAAYQPSSYDDAVAVRTAVVALYDLEIETAADAGQGASYLALRALRTAVVDDLNTRGALLPRLRPVVTATPTSSLELAYRLYGDTSRADEIAARTGAPHPGFLPVQMTLLSR